MNEGLYQGPGPHKIEFIFIFVVPQETDFFVIALVNIEKQVSVEDALSASIRERK